jgi:hypothetical protein
MIGVIQFLLMLLLTVLMQVFKVLLSVGIISFVHNFLFSAAVCSFTEWIILSTFI